jgi:ribosomal protein S18 acetylase RimI-like enzyme
VTAEVLRRGGEAARVAPWRGARSTALLAPGPGLVGTVSPSFLRWCGEQLGKRGFERVVSAALLPTDTHPYRDAGFELFEELHLLFRSLYDLPRAAPSPVRLRRGRRRDLPRVVTIDHEAFQPFWRFDADGISEARLITPRARFRVAEAGRRRPRHLAGYAVTGLGEQQGYLQRLAVSPAWQRQGVGRALVLDALHWLAAHHATQVMVNTQITNDKALALYVSLGFQLDQTRLEVLAVDVR